MLPANVSFTTITGRFIRAVTDGVDVGREPDGVPIPGLTITLTASVPFARNVTASPPVTIIFEPIVCSTNTDGVLVGSDGQPGVMIVASNDPDLEPHDDWTWDVTITGPGTFRRIQFSFVAPSGATLDLTTLIPVPARPGTDIPAWQAVVGQVTDALEGAVEAAASAVTASGAAAGSASDAEAYAVAAGAAAETAATNAVTTAVAPINTVINTGRLSDANLTTKIATVSATEMANAESALRDETVGVVQDVLGGGTTGLVRVELGSLTDLATARPAWDGVVDWFVSHETDVPFYFADGDVVSWVAPEPEPFTPLAVPGVAAWFDAVALDVTLNNGDNVTSWPNLVPTGPAAVASGTFPHFVTAVVNGHPAVQFNGVDGLLTSVLASGYTGPSAIYLVARSLPATTTGTDFFFDGASTLTPQLQLALGRNVTNNWAVYNGDSFTKAGATNAVHLFRIDFKNPLSELFVDGVSLGTGTTDDNRTITKLTLGGRADGATANILDGYICSFVYIQGLVSTEDNIALNTYLKDRYGL